eukprot:TRINITY_DN15121_c0_g1_i1.p1 TRINITY_DN15121_c0_g1~~TRINITY_DN15121_c0_g1_i1.p1  ORF type:complete len:122 (+),score=9.06 TRINITY_DN15121_c0_g1_i1:26-391(+)
MRGRNPYDIHFYFTGETEESALQIRHKLGEKFQFLSLFPPQRGPVGPHPLPMWEGGFHRSQDIERDFGAVLGWLMLNHGQHSVLIHPNTGKNPPSNSSNTSKGTASGTTQKTSFGLVLPFL